MSKYLNLFKQTDKIVSLNELEILSGKYLTAIYAWKVSATSSDSGLSLAYVERKFPSRFTASVQPC